MGAARPMVYLRDEGGVFEGTLDEVWGFVSNPEHHSGAHHHKDVHRSREPGNTGTYSWEQPFAGAPTRFTMHWTAFPPLGIAYEVLEGPFRGSTFFLYYSPREARTEVGVVGTFVSPTIPEGRLEESVRHFFAVEFDQDQAGLARWKAAGAPR
ncbi:MAG: hypothetical protein L3J91_04805 [Thermoplasmata archaeon]|nr:hypothetical protein [Thermoplasmata archaeon]